MDEKHLQHLKSKIDTAKEKVAQLEGRKAYLLQELEQKWECPTLKQAHSKLNQLKKKAEKLDKQIQDGLARLEEKYDLDN